MRTPKGLPDFQGVNLWNANLDISNVNDVQFLTELALHLQTTLELSAECTYSCGYSNGGYMSYTLACAAPEIFKAIGSVGGTMSGADWETCEAQAVPVVHIHGTQDYTVLYGSTLGSNDPWEGAPGVETVVAHWANANGCSEVITPLFPISTRPMAARWTSLNISGRPPRATRPKSIVSIKVAMNGLALGATWIFKVQR